MMGPEWATGAAESVRVESEAGGVRGGAESVAGGVHGRRSLCLAESVAGGVRGGQSPWRAESVAGGVCDRHRRARGLVSLFELRGAGRLRSLSS